MIMRSRPSAVVRADLLALSGLLALLASVPACEGPDGASNATATQAARTTETRQADTTAPLYDTQYAAPPSGMRVLSSEIDEGGNTFVLSKTTPPQDGNADVQLSKFDPNGQNVFTTNYTQVPWAEEPWVQVRTRAGVVAVVGTYSQSFSQRNPQFEIRAFDTRGAPRSQYLGPVGTRGQVLDVCADGSIAAAGASSGTVTILELGPSGSLSWSTTLPGAAQKIRCRGDGSIVLAGSTPAQLPFLAQLESDGTLDWTWIAPDDVSLESFDFDDSGNVRAAGNRTALPVDGGPATSTYAVFAVDPRGQLQWSWTGTQPAVLTSVAAGSTGTTLTGSTPSGGSLTVRLDGGGNIVWTRDDATLTSPSLALDDSGDAFLCGQSPNGGVAALYGADGSTQWSTPIAGFVPTIADSTTGVGLCLGQAPSQPVSPGSSVLAGAVGLAGFSTP